MLGSNILYRLRDLDGGCLFYRENDPKKVLFAKLSTPIETGESVGLNEIYNVIDLSDGSLFQLYDATLVRKAIRIEIDLD